MRSAVRGAVVLVLLGALSPARSWAQDEAPPPASSPGFSSWDFQLLYGTDFQEPFNPHDIAKTTLTIENTSAWSWGSSYFFLDILKSDGNDGHATEAYAEWFPSASLGKLFNSDLSFGPVSDVSATMGFNLGRKSNGAHPLVYVPGLTWNLKIPGFAFFSLGTYAYVDRGKFEGTGNGCHDTTWQVTPAWSLPFDIGSGKAAFDGFVDFIGEHGVCKSQVVSQPQLKVDLGSFGGNPGKYYLGVEWQYWHNKFGNDGLNESFPEILFVWKP